MGRQLGNIIENKFGKGFITEASGLNFPPDAAVSTSNCIFTQKMSITPRYGFNYEAGNVTNAVSPAAGDVILEYLWQGVAGLGNINFVVVQEGATLYFYNVDTATSLSSGIQATTIDLDSFKVSGAPTTAGQYCAFASGNGYLFIAHPYVDPLYVVYDPIALTLTPTQVILQQRDVTGDILDPFYYPWNTRPGANAATGTITFVANPTASDTITLGGTAVTFVASGATGNQINIGSSLATTLVAAIAVLNASVDPEVALCTYGANATVLNITFNAGGTAGNTYTIAASAATASGATLTNGGTATYVDNHHLYNLANQGWLYTNGPKVFGILAFTPTVVAQSYMQLFTYASIQQASAAGLVPSNSDIWWSYKNSGGLFQPETLSGALGTYLNINVGNTPAPKGHFILDCFNQDRSAAYLTETTSLGYADTGAAGIPVVSASYFRPSAVAFFAGRAWFAGVNFGIFTNSIFYSQIIQQQFQIPLCYQSNDPTSDDTGVADLVSSDGGVLIEPEIGQIYKMYPVAYSLLIFASNGVWAITGSTGTGFTATDFSVAKISSVGMISPTSFVDVDGIPYWWNYDGIYTLTGTGGSTSPAGGSGTAVVSATDETIKTFFIGLPTASKLNAKGSYNRRLNTIYWIYNLNTPSTTPYVYDSALCLNTVTKAFYPWTIPTTGVTISGIVTVQGQGYYLTPLNVQQVVNLSSVTKFLTQVNGSFTWSEVADPALLDYSTNPYTAFATSGYSLDQSGTKLQAPYIIFVLNNSLASQIQINAAWNTATVLDTNKLSSYNLLQTEGGNYDYRDFRRKIRGVGRSLQITFTGISGTWFEVAGWYIETSSNSQQ